MNFKHFGQIQKSLMNMPSKWESEAYNEVQRTWFNNTPIKDLTGELGGLPNQFGSQLRLILEEFKKS